MRPDPYSRLIAWLKIILPLMALAILSTLFLLSRNAVPSLSIPFAEGEVTERIKGQQVTRPFYTATTTDGDLIAFTAEDVSRADTSGSVARGLTSRLDLTSGSSLTLIADEGIVDLPADQAEMTGNVTITSSTGYVMRSHNLSTRLSRLEVISPARVTARGPAGALVAGAMRITSDEETNNAYLLFTDGVKLVYDPKDRNKE